MSGRRNPEKPDAWQRQVIRKAGLEPRKWLVVKEKHMYLYLVDRGMEQRENIIIDKDTYEVMRPKRCPPHRRWVHRGQAKVVHMHTISH